jgi:lysophospholipase L1-like esterase
VVRALARRAVPLVLLAIALLVIAGRDGGANRAGARTPVREPARSPVHHQSKRSRPTAKVSLQAPAGGHWLATWGASMQPPSTANPVSEASFVHATLREVVFSSVGGSEVRVRFSNAYGTTPLQIGDASVAIAGAGGSLVDGSARQLTFGGQASVELPPGGEVFSDPVALDVHPLSQLAVSFYLPHPTGPATGHQGSRETNYVAGGDHVDDESAAAYLSKIEGWYFLDGVDVMAGPRYRGSVVAFGDSITAGTGSSLNADANWPDDLARRLGTSTGPSLSVVDEGIGGNRVLNNTPCCGRSALTRFDADVLDQTGVRDVILLEGINDIGLANGTNPLTAPHTPVTAQELIAGYEELITAAHSAGLQIFGATLLPFEGAGYWTAQGERVREAVNHWILTSGAFDGVINFAAAVADPTDPQRLNPAYDSGDHLHPNDAGYRAMAEAVDIPALLGTTSSDTTTAASQDGQSRPVRHPA